MKKNPRVCSSSRPNASFSKPCNVLYMAVRNSLAPQGALYSRSGSCVTGHKQSSVFEEVCFRWQTILEETDKKNVSWPINEV